MWPQCGHVSLFPSLWCEKVEKHNLNLPARSVKTECMDLLFFFFVQIDVSLLYTSRAPHPRTRGAPLAPLSCVSFAAPPRGVVLISITTIPLAVPLTVPLTVPLMVSLAVPLSFSLTLSVPLVIQSWLLVRHLL